MQRLTLLNSINTGKQKKNQNKMKNSNLYVPKYYQHHAKAENSKRIKKIPNGKLEFNLDEPLFPNNHKLNFYKSKNKSTIIFK